MNSGIVMRASAVRANEFDWGSLRWLASRQLGNSDALTAGLCVLRPGAANPRHHHPNCEEVLHVLEGRISHALGNGSEAELGPGDTVTLPAGAAHYARNVGGADAVLFVCFSSADRETVGE
jgi:quercetin dioxygenase-like cupin family protein